MRKSVSAVPLPEMAGVPDVEGVDKRRCRRLNKADVGEAGPVLYWMSRDQRAEDNWALTYAQQLAKKRKAALHVAFCLVPKFLDATIRQFDFMLKGLQEVETTLREAKVPFHLVRGKAPEEIPALCARLSISAVVCDMSPLRVPMGWARGVADALQAKDIPVIQVDAHNVVPIWVASDKQEYAARTIRKKVMTALGTFLTDFPPLATHPHPAPKEQWPDPVNWEDALASLEVDCTVGPVKGFVPGPKAAAARLEDFCAKRLSLFESKRNDPMVDACSGLSPYLHFGQISAQRCALKVRKLGEVKGAAPSLVKSCESFIEESVVRRELSDNFCFYNDKYDSLDGAPGWAVESLRIHEKDPREHLYTYEELETAKTHDDVWNAAQLQMVLEGKMHGFLRMYWAKKILEWTSSPKEALEFAIRLNDRFELDGRDPNGYVGCMWSIAGVHDQGWAERKVFGKIRYMNYAGCKRKFDIAGFVARYPGAKPAGAAAEPPPKKRRGK